MKLFKNMTVSKKLSMLFVPAFLVIFAFFFLFIYEIKSTEKELQKTYYDEAFTSTSLILNADRDYYQADLAEFMLVSGTTESGNKQQLLKDDYKENILQVEDRVNNAVDNIKNNTELYSEYTDSTTGETMSELYNEFTTNFNNWKSNYDINTMTGDMNSHMIAFDSARAKINSMTELLNDYANYKSSYIKRNTTQTIYVVSIIMIVIFILVFTFAIYLTKYLKKSIQAITENMVQLSENDLAFEPFHVASKDELGTLTRSIQTVVFSLKNIIELLKATSQKLTSTSSSMKINSEEITISMNQIATTVGEIAESAGHKQ